MFNLHRTSFRGLLLVAFLLVPTLLAAVSVHGLYTLEQLMLGMRRDAQRVVGESVGAQRLAERTVTMERAARQYLVLGDEALRARFDTAAREADEDLGQLVASLRLDAHGEHWRSQLRMVRAQLSDRRLADARREQAVAQSFFDLNRINSAIALQVQRAGEQRNRVLLAQLESARSRLGRQLLGAIVLAGLLALALGIWLTRPLKALEKAIVGLGENRMAEAIEIRGPADMRLLGRRLDWLRLRLMELDTDKARFLRHVSHELKTPLAALREGVALLEEGVTGSLNNGQRDVVRILRQNTGVLQGQIEDLLQFNAIAFEARRLTRRSNDLIALIETLIDQQRLQWQARRLAVTVSGTSAWAEVDAEKLTVALGNLLSNAIRFSPPGGAIRFVLARHDRVVRIDLIDAGPGIDPVDGDRVFEPFYRGVRQPNGAVRGSGIGLSIVWETVAAHGGRVALLPDGPGAHFSIELPYAQDGQD